MQTPPYDLTVAALTGPNLTWPMQTPHMIKQWPLYPNLTCPMITPPHNKQAQMCAEGCEGGHL